MFGPFSRGSPAAFGRSPHDFPLRRLSPRRKNRGAENFGALKLIRKDGRLLVDKFPRDGSGLISSLREADGFIEVAEDVDEIRIGEVVDFIPFSEFGLGHC